MDYKTLFEEAIKLLESTSGKQCSDFIDAIQTDRTDIEAILKILIAGFSSTLEFISLLTKRIETLEQSRN